MDTGLWLILVAGGFALGWCVSGVIRLRLRMHAQEATLDRLFYLLRNIQTLDTLRSEKEAKLRKMMSVQNDRIALLEQHQKDVQDILDEIHKKGGIRS